MLERWWRSMWVLGVLGALVLLAAVVWVVGALPPALAGPVPAGPTPGARDAEITAAATRYAAYRSDITTTRTGLIAGLAGLAALGSLAVTARTYRLSLQGQLTDRYTKAVAQLGDDKLDIRLGGIYALERLAMDSKRDHPTVVEVLSAYVRERTRNRAAPRTRPPGRRTAYPLRLTSTPEPIAVDIQAALTVLGWLPTRAGVIRANLAGANLGGAGLAGVNLSGATLVGADLTGAILVEANLTGTLLVGANMTRALLGGANLTEATLGKTNLTRANLYRANLTKAVVLATNLTYAVLSETVLTNTELGRVNLTGAVGLTQTQLNCTRGDLETVLPSGLTRPATWVSSAEPPESAS